MDRYLTSSSPLMDNELDVESFLPDIFGTTNLPVPTIPDTQETDGSLYNPVKIAQDAANMLEAIDRAPITEECKARVKSVLNGMMKGSIPSPTDGVWAQSIIAAAMGQGSYPAECKSSALPLWIWAALGGVACITVWIVLSKTSKKK